MTPLQIPITPQPVFRFSVSLDGIVVDFRFRWNLTLRQWFFDLSSVELAESLQGAPVVTGVDLLAPYAIRELGSLYVVDDRDLGVDPDFDGFGSRWNLLYAPRAV